MCSLVIKTLQASLKTPQNNKTHKIEQTAAASLAQMSRANHTKLRH